MTFKEITATLFFVGLVLLPIGIGFTAGIGPALITVAVIALFLAFNVPNS